MVEIVDTVAGLRRAVASWRGAGERVGLVPTMGALHAGHLALVASARATAPRTIVSIFVNPKQFGRNEDFSTYPRQLERDVAALVPTGCDVVFAPGVGEMYPEGFASRVEPGPLGEMLEGAHRPGFFAGVSTVVAKLLLQSLPDLAVFGEKDYQQLLVIRRIARDLDIPVEIVGAPTVREADGLALSSRNVYLSSEERGRAPVLHRVLRHVADTVAAGGDATAALDEGRAAIAAAGLVLDYLELRDATTLEPVLRPTAPARALVAARLGSTRLIDNVAALPPGAA